MQLLLDMDVGTEWDLALRPNEHGKYNFVWQDEPEIDLRQRIKYYLRTYRGEYPIREELGLPYFEQFFRKGVEPAAIENTITQYIADRLYQDTAYQVQEIECKVMNYNPAKRVLELFLFLKTDITEVTINEIF
ncbi:MAG: hypothetical protein LBH98_03175 [Chitinispirillales bacterium]|jgi:hypothetical protein|nr:hypothetical protein [Chitinispirillales bacterium]